MSSIAIMQGRLSPPFDGTIQAFPVDSWRAELPRAAAAGLDGIEWIYDAVGEGANPIETDVGIEELLTLAAEAGVSVTSLCADWFIPNRLLRAAPAERAERVERLMWLIDRCGMAGIRRVVLPFVDESSLQGSAGHRDLLETLARALPEAERAGVELHLETDLDPAQYRALLDRVEHDLLKVNYDSGNSASLGYEPREELAAYGQRIGSVHVKDRVAGGATVPLGEGAADLATLFRELRRAGYDGGYVLQVARGEPGGEVAWAERNRREVERLMAESGA